MLEKPTAERILKEENQTEREVLIQRMGVANFVQEAELRPIDSYRDSVLLKVNATDRRGRYRNGSWIEEPLALAFLKVVCPSTQKSYFLRVDSDAENAKQAFESTLPGSTAIEDGIASQKPNPPHTRQVFLGLPFFCPPRRKGLGEHSSQPS